MTAPHTTASPAEAAPQGTHTFLSSRLVVTGILAAGLALLTVVVALTGVDYWSSRASMLQDSRVEAAIVADNISAAVMFRDNTAANEMLGALRSSSMVISATVYDEDGVLFAHYARTPDPGLPTTLQAVGLNGATERADWRMLEIARPIEVSAKGWGTLYIRKSMEALYTRLALRFGSALLIAACVMALATAMVLRSRAAVREAEDRLHTLAHTDAVTGMGNRHAFNERLSAELDRARSMRQRVALVYIDLDNFKTLNDTFGHAAGDGLLRQVARRLQSVVRGTDTIARLGGDEFALILRLDMDEAGLEKYAQRIVNVFQAAYTEVGQQVNMTCSAGIATFPDDAPDMDALVSNADTAMYRAKEMGKNRCVRFDASMNLAVVRRRAIEQALRAELEQGTGLALHYQPLFAASDRTLVGAEALLRWTHAELGAVSPLEAVSVAEDCGLIAPLGYWVMRTACRDAAQWKAGKPLRVAVNISARQLGDPQFLERVMDILREEGLPAHLLEIELTETVLMENMEAGAHTLHRLSQLGIHLAIDDFGTGYSSLAYLRQLPMRRLKIDRSFVKDLPGQEHSRTIVTAIVALAHGLGLEVTAEGVETQEQADYLVRQGCDVLQGYVFARPMPAPQFLELQAGVSA
ncbi:MAG TPA: EAL domain-containing protein [Acidovorax sp.]|nr:EAL domain-containing protein [Acidovorax sp.]